MKRFIFFGLLMGLLFSSCTKDEQQIPSKVFSFDFNKIGQENWTAGFADYSDTYGNLELKGELALLPQPLNPSSKDKGVMMQGDNKSDDLFMFLKRKVSGLEPNQSYTVDMNIRFASDAPANAVGIGGGPGVDVFVKAGVVTAEPTVSKDSSNYYRISVDKGNQGQGGKDMKLVGNVANGLDKTQYVSLLRKTTGLQIKTNDKGECWLIIGTDSGYEGLTRVYYQTVEAQFKAL